MKQILFITLFVAGVGVMALANGLDINGEWVVGKDDVSGSGIVINLPAESSNRQSAPDVRMPVGRLPQQTPGNSARKSVSYDYFVIPVGTLFDFAANGAKLTGSVIRYETEEPILDGKINGNKISFTVKETVKGKEYTYLYRGELSDGSIRFDVTPTTGGKQFQFRAKRVDP